MQSVLRAVNHMSLQNRTFFGQQPTLTRKRESERESEREKERERERDREREREEERVRE